MRLYLLDSPILAGYLHGRPAALRLVEPWVEYREAATSILVYGEVTEYLRDLPNSSERQNQLRRVVRTVYPFYLGHRIMERYADLRRQLRPPHGLGLIGDIDTLIAATALVQDLTVVTTDRDFARVPDLKVMLLPRESLRR